MSRQIDFVTLALVTIVTILIWLWAASNTSEDTTVVSRIDFAVKNPGQYVVEPDHHLMTLNIGGPKHAVDSMRALVESKTLALNPTAKDGQYTFEDLAKEIQDLPEVRETGVTIESTDPTRLTVTITELVTVEAVVRPSMPVGLLVKNPAVETSVAKITLPSNEVKLLGEKPTLEAVVNPKDIQNLEPGVLHTVNGTLQLPADLGTLDSVRIEPATARVSFRLVSRKKSLTLDKVYVQVLVSPDVTKSFEIKLPESLLRSVQVEASTELAERLEAGTSGEAPGTRVVAVIPLTNLELERGIESKQVAYFMALLPDGTGEEVTASVNGNEHPEIELQVTKITTPATP